MANFYDSIVPDNHSTIQAAYNSGAVSILVTSEYDGSDLATINFNLAAHRLIEIDPNIDLSTKTFVMTVGGITLLLGCGTTLKKFTASSGGLLAIQLRPGAKILEGVETTGVNGGTSVRGCGYTSEVHHVKHWADPIITDVYINSTPATATDAIWNGNLAPSRGYILRCKINSGAVGIKTEENAGYGDTVIMQNFIEAVDQGVIINGRKNVFESNIIGTTGSDGIRVAALGDNSSFRNNYVTGLCNLQAGGDKCNVTGNQLVGGSSDSSTGSTITNNK